jgi:hypothetical protein
LDSTNGVTVRLRVGAHRKWIARRFWRHLTLQAVIDANVDNLEEEADEAIVEAKAEFNEAVGSILGV